MAVLNARTPHTSAAVRWFCTEAQGLSGARGFARAEPQQRQWMCGGRETRVQSGLGALSPANRLAGPPPPWGCRDATKFVRLLPILSALEPREGGQPQRALGTVHGDRAVGQQRWLGGGWASPASTTGNPSPPRRAIRLSVGLSITPAG